MSRRTRLALIAVLLAAVGAGGGALLLSDSGSADGGEGESGAAAPVGAEVVLAPGRDESVLLAGSMPAFRTLTSALRESSMERVRAVVDSLDVVAVEAGTLVRVVDRRVTVVNVRVLEGEYEDRTGWIPASLLGD